MDIMQPQYDLLQSAVVVQIKPCTTIWKDMTSLGFGQGWSENGILGAELGSFGGGGG